MANVVELKAGEDPPETPYVLVLPEAGRQHTETGDYSYGFVRRTPDDAETIEREIRYAKDEAKLRGFKTIYIRR